VAAYAGVAFFFAVSRSMWIRVHGGGYPAEAAPPIGRLLMTFAAAFGWIVFLTAVMPWTELHREEVHREIADLFKPFILIIGINWILMRFPRFVFIDSSCPSLGINKKESHSSVSIRSKSTWLAFIE
jgi:hypothetical protein